eukprot:TRINITY_DN21967_c0_g1_i1.p1 TRINITY_DN21967_c0_g1~~TRINITY_DN21967_c0_g1_i1.p1  ORF type:complete len:333 (-),score=41.36 TRINITY_DN21967_c0_g1_i1:142-1140(-)
MLVFCLSLICLLVSHAEGLSQDDCCCVAVEGDECYKAVTWAMDNVIHASPELYPGVNVNSTFVEFQAALHDEGYQTCPHPCVKPATTSTADDCCCVAAPGDRCYEAVEWAMNTGIWQHPDWYPGISGSSSFVEFQAVLHRDKTGNCPDPCPSTTAAPPKESSGLDPKCSYIALEGTGCYKSVKWVMDEGIHARPDYYRGLTSASTFTEVQTYLYRFGDAGCGHPCQPKKWTRAECCCLAAQNSECYNDTFKAMFDWIYEKPAWFKGLDDSSTFSEFQERLHVGQYSKACKAPCCGKDCDCSCDLGTGSVSQASRLPQPAAMTLLASILGYLL